ncbi:uncharacterized protein LOC115158935 [Salmo trutta]|uniref:uncharacterized protein LOC115158935 n=1 Tax=Salmo trutta TaxID=8032 RepID=UPI001130C81C|nr:uncharacterized protein LOC115158935 [Salmo trutta]
MVAYENTGVRGVRTSGTLGHLMALVLRNLEIPKVRISEESRKHPRFLENHQRRVSNGPYCHFTAGPWEPASVPATGLARLQKNKENRHGGEQKNVTSLPFPPCLVSSGFSQSLGICCTFAAFTVCEDDVFIPENIFILVETVQEAEEERKVSTACQTDPWVPECSCAAAEKRSTGTITKELGAQLDCAHDHQYTTESCPYTPQVELTESKISEDHNLLYEPESSESQSSQCEPRYTINHFGGVGWCSENGEGAGHSSANSKIYSSIKGIEVE